MTPVEVTIFQLFLENSGPEHMGKKQKYQHIRVADLLRIFIFPLSIRHISAADSCISRSLSAEMDFPEV